MAGRVGNLKSLDWKLSCSFCSSADTRLWKDCSCLVACAAPPSCSQQTTSYQVHHLRKAAYHTAPVQTDCTQQPLAVLTVQPRTSVPKYDPGNTALLKEQAAHKGKGTSLCINDFDCTSHTGARRLKGTQKQHLKESTWTHKPWFSRAVCIPCWLAHQP